jgi:hypothetical protein
MNQLANYKKKHEACEIRMPRGTSGTVFYAQNRKSDDSGQMLLGPGSVVSEGQSVFKIPNPSKMIVNLHVNEAEGVLLQTGMPARIRIVDETYQGRVTVAKRLNRRKPSDDGFETYTTTVRIEGNLPKGIEPGMTAEVTIKRADVKDQVYLPKEAVLNYGGKRFCLVKINENLYEPRELVIGLANNKYVEVNSGISEGEAYLLKPADWLTLFELPPVDGPAIDGNFLSGIVTDGFAIRRSSALSQFNISGQWPPFAAGRSPNTDKKNASIEKPTHRTVEDI